MPIALLGEDEVKSDEALGHLFFSVNFDSSEFDAALCEPAVLLFVVVRDARVTLGLVARDAKLHWNLLDLGGRQSDGPGEADVSWQ